jgi:hypothetical protein
VGRTVVVSAAFLDELVQANAQHARAVERLTRAHTAEVTALQARIKKLESFVPATVADIGDAERPVNRSLQE